MKQSDVQRIIYIKKYCESVAKTIERFGCSLETFSADEDYYNAVSMCVYQIGEISGGLSDDFRADTKQQMEWHKIRGMRNIFAHHYHKMNKETVWMTATENIPAMLDFCNKIIADNSEDFAPPQRPEWI